MWVFLENILLAWHDHNKYKTHTMWEDFNPWSHLHKYRPRWFMWVANTWVHSHTLIFNYSSLWIMIIRFIVRAFSICLALHQKQINVYKGNQLEKKINKKYNQQLVTFSPTPRFLCVCIRAYMSSQMMLRWTIFASSLPWVTFNSH